MHKNKFKKIAQEVILSEIKSLEKLRKLSIKTSVKLLRQFLIVKKVR